MTELSEDPHEKKKTFLMLILFGSQNLKYKYLAQGNVANMCLKCVLKPMCYKPYVHVKLPGVSAMFKLNLQMAMAEVESRLKGKIIHRPREQVWMLKADSVSV